MTANCPRRFEVEALRDGRLQGTERAHFQTHLDTCSDCSREARELDALAAALRAPSNAPADQLHVRRERTRLLAAFDASLVPDLPATRNRSWLRFAPGLLALAALAALGFALWPTSSSSPPVPLAVHASEAITVRADSRTDWSRHDEIELDKIILRSGALSIRVEPTQPRRRLLVILPDGELEDIGTTFSVSADTGRTTRVTVQEGSVVLRLRGKAPLALGAGDFWTPPALVTPPLPAAPASSALPATNAAPAARGSSASASVSAGTATSASASPVRDASADFRAAMSAFDAGDHAGAVARFGAFISAHPRDSRVEDAAYLRVLALQRSGNRTATQRAARDYLELYPGGFRRAEVEGLAR